MTGSRVFRRLYLGYVVLVVVTAAVGSVLVGRRIESEALREAHDALRNRALLVREIARPAFEEPRSQPPDSLVATLGRLAADTETRFTLIGPDGRVLVDTERPAPTLPGHGQLPEILQAAQRGEGLATRVSDTTRRRTMFVAVRAEAGEGGFVRASMGIRRIDERRGELRTVVAAAAAIAALVGLAFGGFVVRSYTAPLVEMSRAARAIAAGDLDQRIDVRRDDEIGVFARAFNRMAGQLRERIQLVTDERNRLLAILGSMVEGVVAVDADERVLHLNAPAAEMLGADAEAALGEPFGAITRMREVRDALVATLTSGRATSGEVMLPGQPEDRILEIHAAPIRPGHGHGDGAVLVLHDVTELRRLEAVRRDFVANVSHELKTPLTVIRGLVETLQEDDGIDATTRGRFLEKVSDQTRRLSSIVTDLLTLSRVESDPADLAFGRIDLRQLLEDVARDARPAAEAAGVELSAEVPADPVEVEGDEGFLRLAVDNLVVNAVKYTPAGGSVRLRLGMAGGRARIEVRDTGIGIEEKHRARLFERFYRVDAARSRELGGTGLGLSIVKHVTRAHGGDVDFESVPGEGSTFRLLLPLPAPPRRNRP